MGDRIGIQGKLGFAVGVVDIGSEFLIVEPHSSSVLFILLRSLKNV